MSELDEYFPRYLGFDPAVPTWCVTPNCDRVIHRFFDTSPFSPSGRLLGLTRLPYEDRRPRPGDVAEVIVVDLQTGELRVVAETRGWDVQLGAQVQWGADDSSLFFNDVDIESWRAFGARLDPETGVRRALAGPVYTVSPDGKWAASPCLLRIGRTQAGYGVVVPDRHVPVNRGAPADDGIYLTNTETGRSRLLLSLAEIVETATPKLVPGEWMGGDFYGFHVKWSPDGERLQFVVRWLPHDSEPGPPARRHQLITMNADGSELRVAVPASEWDKGGNHPNWCPDSEHVIMNLKQDGETMRFVRARYDGSQLRALADNIRGSGHPTMHPNLRHILTDAKPKEPVAFGDGTVPIRLIDLDTRGEKTLVRINAVPKPSGGHAELRLDPHPAWDSSYRRIAFNACPDGTRRVFVSDLGRELAG